MEFSTNVVYLIAGILWGMYTLKWQARHSLVRWWLCFCFLINFLFWPLGTLVAFIRFEDIHKDC